MRIDHGADAEAAVERAAALADEWERTAVECERLSHVYAGLSDQRDLRTAAILNRRRSEDLRNALAGPTVDGAA